MKTKLLLVFMMSVISGSILIAQAPANDDCTGAIALTVNGISCTGAVTGDVTGATNSIPGLTCNGFTGSASRDVWYSFVATSTAHDITVVGSSGFSAIVDLRSGGCNGTNINCADNLSSNGETEIINATGLTIGNTYYVRVYHFTASTYTFTICVTIPGPPPSPPANDDCTGAIALTVNSTSSCSGAITGDVAGATQSIPAISCINALTSTPGTANDDVWYSFVASANNLDITVVGSASFDAVIDLRSGTCNGANIDCADRTPQGGTEVLNATGLTIGDTYFVRVYHWASSVPVTKTFTICVSTPFDPAAAAIGSLCPRATMINNYVNDYLGSNVTDSELAWTGNGTTCAAGTISTIAQNRTLTRVNYFRQLVGLPGNITLNATLNGNCQEAALMMDVNGQLNHTPPTSWTCYTSNGALAASKSNLTQNPSVNGIKAMIDDYGPANTQAGHRRWILNSKADIFGIGSTLNYAVLWISPSAIIPAANINYIAYPSAGFFPAPLIPTSNRWSFGKDGADFTNSIVQMTDASGASVSLTIESSANTSVIGDNSIVWVPSGIITNSAADLAYTVHVNNVVNSGVSSNYSYTVTICPIAYPPQCPAGSSWSEANCNCSGPAGINQISANQEDISIYPNPASNYFNLVLNTNENIKDAIVALYDISGRKISSEKITTKTTSIGISHLVNGIYYIIVENAGKQYQEKIIVNK